MPKNRVFHRTEIDAIVDRIRNWPKETISWSDVCKIAESILGFRPSRQGMHQREPIREAFQAKKNNLRAKSKVTSPMPSSLAVASRRIGSLEAELSEVKAKNIRLNDCLQIWRYNAHLKGMTDALLNKPLPLIDREVGTPTASNPTRESK